jgi:hypothetical protein
MSNQVEVTEIPMWYASLLERVEYTEDGCWRWTGGCFSNGYSRLNRAGRQWLGHRITYIHDVGPVPAGMDLDHLCRRRNCINPAHLEVVTRSENLKRGVGVGGNRAPSQGFGGPSE